MKKYMWTILTILILIIAGTWWWQNNQNTVPPDQTASTTPVTSTTKTFTSADQNVSFNYPTSLSVSQKNNIITLHHQINFLNTDACDFKGTAGASPTLTDFNVTMQMFNGTMASTAAVVDPTLATSSENIDGTLDVSPGLIDYYNNGSWNGYMVTEGVEGCGQITYYLPISTLRTLVVQKQLIGALSDVADPTNKARILATPGAISPDKSNQLFNSIIQTLQVR